MGDLVADAADCRRDGERIQDLFERVFPMDVRPQAHDIIRTWLFDTVLRSHFEFGTLPWKNAAISGWVLDPGPEEDVEVEGQRGDADGPARRARLRRRALLGGERQIGTDTAFDPGQMKVGRRLAIKLLNASKFVLANPESARAVSRRRSIADS